MGNNAEYMILGYAAMAIILFGMVAWLYWRYVMARREEQLLTEFEAEQQADSVKAAVGAMEEDVLPQRATPGQSGMSGPSSERVRTLPDQP
ncbi:MAG TPA: hypothetical protein PKD09_22065 [Aggregatilinea sp.]|jgi:Flp pilus assembly protein TadB|uniref:hypothetical protein n=1 Tax=Aggregatilinea sp. TaxID=2806333 RepID=UPI002CBC7508|nr:hypothetical protein [Aggregatilinea sp.]HML24357.1 hypothetical protein [Aggregatilinea sp.]